MRVATTRSFSIMVAFAVGILAVPVRAEPAPLPLIPMPASVERLEGGMVVESGTIVSTSGTGAQLAGRLLIEQTRTSRGIELAPGRNGRIRIELDDTVKGAEAYRLTVDDRGIRVSASTPQGLIYGAMTLAQLLSPDRAFGQPVRVPALRIEDAPRFAWRGYMADPARHFQPIAALRKTIDQMAALKLNRLHLHLSDDQGWRVEIKRYPKLTEIGAWRTPPSTGAQGEPTRYGGFYTQEELRDLVAYAAERGITIVPEIDLPGHAQAIVASYPEFGVFGDRPEVGVDWGVAPYLIDPGPQGVQFVKHVLDELMDIFPGEYIHLGGDEAIKDQWERSPRVQALMREKGIATENALQTDLIRQFDAYLRAHGRRLIGWDEILEGGELPATATVMSWRGEAGAIEAAGKGHDVVLSPAPILYLDNLQSWLPDEPPQRPANPPMSLQRVYDYDAMPDGIAPADRDHVLGAQMNAWSEYLVTPRAVWHATFPRLAAFAEGVWSPREARDFHAFLPRLEAQFARWERAEIPAADSAFAVAFALRNGRAAALRSGTAMLALSSQTGHGTIRYTLDGSEPLATSPAYSAPLALPLGSIVRAASFNAAGDALSRPRSYETSRGALLATGSINLSICGRGVDQRTPLYPDQESWVPAINMSIYNSCQIWPDAPLAQAGGFAIDVARIPRNYALAHAYDEVKRYFPATRFGELVVRTGEKCDGPVVGGFALPDPAASPARQRFSGPLPADAPDGPLCFTFTAPISGPLYAVESITLEDAQ